jgi:MFS family permease
MIRPRSSRSRSLPIQALMLGSLVSTFGNQLTALAVPWFVLETTGSASKTGLVAAATLAPTVLSMLFGGTVVDRVQQKHLAIGSDVLSGLTVAAVPLFYSTVGLSFWGLVCMMFAGAIFDGPGSTARQTMVPALARRAEIPLEQVNARFGAIRSATELIGAPVAGLLIAILGAANVLWLNAATFVISALLVVALVPPAADPIASGRSFLADVRDGFVFFLGNRPLRVFALTATAVNFLLSPLFGVAIPYFAKTVYESSTKLGLMMGAFGLGGLLGALAYGYLGRHWPRRTLIIVTMCLFGVPMWVMALQPQVAVMCALVLAMGFGSGLVNPMAGTIIQQGVPEHMLGRALGTLSSTAMVAAPLGMLLGGSVIGLLGLTGAIVAIAAIFLALIVATIANPAFRELEHFGREPEPADSTYPAAKPVSNLA